MKNLLIVLVCLLLVIAISIFFGSQWAEDKIEKKIASIPFLSYDSLEIDIMDRSLKLHNLIGNKNGYEGSVELLEINGLHIWPILRNEEFIVDDVIVDGVDFSYRIKKSKVIDNQLDSDTIDIPFFNIRSIDVRSAGFIVLDESGSKLFEAKLNATLDNVSSSDLHSPGNIPSKLRELKGDSARFYTKNGLYTIDLAEAIYRDSALVIKDASFQSDLQKEEIGRYIGHEVDWLHVKVDSIVIEIKNPAVFLKKPQIQRVEIFRPNVDVFRDKRLPSPKNHKPPLLRHILGNSEYSFAFDTILIHNGKVVYEEFVKEEKGPGEASFHRINANITNMKSYSMGLSQRPRLVASCFIYDSAELFIDASFPINDQSTQTLVKGKMMPVDLTIFNRMIRYVSVVEVKSGYSKMLEFDFTYTDQLASGEMKFAYNDLAIAFLEKQESEPDGVLSAVKSFFVNSFVIDSNNDFQSNKFRVGKIDFERIGEKSIFNYWWGAIISGFKSSTGVNASGEKIDTN